MNRTLERLMPLFLILIVGTLWEFAVQFHWVNELVMPGPKALVLCLIRDREELWGAFQVTAKSAGMGFVLSSVVGLFVGVVLTSSKWMLKAVYPFTVFFQTIPIIAIAPLLVIWFGYGVPSVVASAFIVSIFPMIANSVSGLISTDPALLDLFKLYRANFFETLFKLKLPYALPYILTGLRIVAGLAVIGTIVGEFIGGVGLGSVVEVARVQQRVDKVFAVLVLTSLLGLAFIVALNGVVYLAEKRRVR